MVQWKMESLRKRNAYGFSFDEEKVHNEYLYHWPNGREALIFSRENGKYEFRENVNEQITLSNRTPENKLYLVSSNDWNLPQTENAYKWFLEKLTFFMEQAPASSETVARIVSGDDKKARILKELLIADLGISDVTVKKTNGNAPVITTTHRVEGEDGSVSYFQLLMEQESAGTQRFFFPHWRLIEMIQDGSINAKGAQLLFTTHDAMLLDLSFLRRDQIWFAEKNEHSCATEIYSLSTFSPRKGVNIRKGYLQGRFGAVPFIGSDGL